MSSLKELRPECQLNDHFVSYHSDVKVWCSRLLNRWRSKTDVNVFWLATFSFSEALLSDRALHFSSLLKIGLDPIGEFCPFDWGCRIHRLHLCRGVKKKKPMRLPVSRGWRPIMLKDGILVAEQSLIWQPKRSWDLQHFTSLWPLLG